MRILLIAYEFPPSPSAQSLRWAYLSGRLAALGHEVHVMAPDISGSVHGLPILPPSIRVHRVYPGPVRSMLERLKARRPIARTNSAPEPDSDTPRTPAIAPPKLNWKGRLVGRVQRVISEVRFPDLRGEWLRPAQRELGRLLQAIAPDVVVSSHEPATTLQVGLNAGRAGYPWVADLGDPVLAPYTPARWRKRSGRLERDVLRGADHVMVTNERTRDLLCERHGARFEGVSVVPQGFDEARSGVALTPSLDADGMTRLLYAGSFYSFRSPAALIEAVLQVPGVRLEIASANVPDAVAALATRYPTRIGLLGHVSHNDILALQRRAHVLVNLANRDACQVPGKFYEYFGACRPILHVQSDSGDADATGDLLAKLRRGWSVPGNARSIAVCLERIRGLHLGGKLEADVDLSAERVAPWSWSEAANSVAGVLEDVLRHARRKVVS